MTIPATPAPAVVGWDGPPITFEQFCASSNRMAHGLRSRGVRKGDCVVVALENCPGLLAATHAMLRIGVYVTPVNPHSTEDELAHIIGDCRPAVVIVDSSSASATTDAIASRGRSADCLVRLGPADRFDEYPDLAEGQIDEEPDDLAAGELMLYTSGTTGKVKAVRRPLTPSAVPGLPPDFAASPSMAVLAELNGPHLSYQPMFFKGPLLIALGCLHRGRPVLLRRSPLAAEELLRLLESHHVVSFNTDPHMLSLLLRLPEQRRRSVDLGALRRVIHSGAPCPVDVKRRVLDWLGPIVWEVYGTTEGTATVAGPHDWSARPGTVGRAIPGGEIAILAADRSPCTPGEIGTVYIKSPPVLAPFEYLNDPQKTAANRHGLFFTVGDLGYVDDDGWLFLTGRTADIINVAGLNVYGAEVEDVIRRHPDVCDVAVIGVTSPETGEEVTAVVELGPEGQPAPRLTAELASLCREHLAPHKRPVAIDFVEALPRNERGKVLREVLRSEREGRQ